MKAHNFRIVIALAGLLAVFLLAGSTEKVQADPSRNADVSGFCTANNDFGVSHGHCVSVGETNVNALAQRGVTDVVTICKVLEQVFGPFPLGSCVSHFASN